MPKSIFIDTSRCTACRGCQLACKEWFELPANHTKQKGTHQNPPDLNPHNYKLVRFFEHRIDGVTRWFFFPDQCRHCVEPPCKMTADSYVEGAIIQDKATGAVVVMPEAVKLTAEQSEEVRQACPYDIPRYDAQLKRLTKCSMCFERQGGGMLPACVKVCPTGTMNFGERSAMLALAEARLAEVKRDFPRAMLGNPDDVSVIFLLLDEPTRYHPTAVAELGVPAPAAPMSRKSFLAGLTRPVRRVTERG
ncbi:4Fe-4S ferredoxin, iron-sulpur binding domain-containing protein [Desulfovibrio sp. X2]|uniref:4Fe-4S dicluster domain-containing protein n=1 Tax=Desulfovibrio sp. X2 TaxID=941449 RepID=UPI00035877DC|nr:4Fe-4S dicluster domain-containing protein [Desulfovibrio sp. X2]EPR44393.1 4Fe-4S ferredoxin, iron-sulpur binding domain-containing protein [Desulfovibrio sp. X2]